GIRHELTNELNLMKQIVLGGMTAPPFMALTTSSAADQAYGDTDRQGDIAGSGVRFRIPNAVNRHPVVMAASGSIASVWLCQRIVRLPQKSGAKADIAGSRIRASSGPQLRCSKQGAMRRSNRLSR